MASAERRFACYRTRQSLHAAIYIVLAVSVVGLDIFAAHLYLQPRQPLQQSLPRIAHAGGAFNGKTYTNSIEALEQNASFYDAFELDFRLTKDGMLVCNYHATGTPVESMAFATFKARDAEEDYSACTAETLRKWMEKYPDKRIVTDVKSDNIRTLEFIRRYFPDAGQRFIAQIYDPSQYDAVRDMGFRDIIWTLYRYDGSARESLTHIRNMKLYAVTLSDKKRIIRTRILLHHLSRLGTPTYLHTVNTADRLAFVKKLGATEIYTDILKP